MIMEEHSDIPATENTEMEAEIDKVIEKLRY